MTPKISYHVYDFLTGTYVATLPQTSVRFGDTLNGSQSYSGTVAVSDPVMKQLDIQDVTTPGKRVIVVDVDGVPWMVYVITARKRKLSAQGPALMISGNSLYWWLTKRMQAADYSDPPYSSISGASTPMTLWNQIPADSTLIAAQVLSDALAYARYGNVFTGTDVLGGLDVLINGAAPNPSAPVVPSVDWIEPTFPYSSLSTLDAILQQITQLGYGVGCDIGFDIAYSNGPFSALIGAVDISFPRRGRTAAASQIVINANQCRGYDLDESCENQAVIAYESGVTGSMAIVENVAPVEQGWPIIEHNFSRSQLQGPNAIGILESLGLSDSYLNSFPVFSGTITMPLFGDDPKIGSFVTGDSALVLRDPDDNFPGGIRQELRIVGFSATVKEEGDSTIDYSLNVPPSTSPATGPAF